LALLRLILPASFRIFRIQLERMAVGMVATHGHASFLNRQAATGAEANFAGTIEQSPSWCAGTPRARQTF
jgi:hypothetical protein